jgi:hypothetical protein
VKAIAEISIKIRKRMRLIAVPASQNRPDQRTEARLASTPLNLDRMGGFRKAEQGRPARGASPQGLGIVTVEARRFETPG